ncbi:hypothetical protein SBA4_3860008 [Candidatus Sulfopaludibacter sp. SbA4]|nr:hypothetical protein SBA4_3860008 [Candidatus Sulfopaludibacter sp. SbA4]
MDDFRLGAIGRYDLQAERKPSDSSSRRKNKPPKDPIPGEDQFVVTSEDSTPDAEWVDDSYTPSGG